MDVARSLKLVSMKEWQAWCTGGVRPPSVPAKPHRTHKDHGWQGWGHWLGTGNIKLGTTQFLAAV